MVELLLILGLVYVLGVTILMHVSSTINLSYMQDLTGAEADPSLHPWFFLAEAALVLSILYIVLQVS